MLILYCMLFLSVCSVVMGLLGFWIGRCARRLPIIDDNLPWTLHRDQASAPAANTAKPHPEASQ